MRLCGHLTAVGEKCVKEISEPSWWCGMQRHPPNPPEDIDAYIGYLAVMFWLDDSIDTLDDWDLLDENTQSTLTEAMSDKLFGGALLSRSLEKVPAALNLEITNLEAAEAVLLGYGLSREAEKVRKADKKTLAGIVSSCQKTAGSQIASELAREAFGIGMLTAGEHTNMSLWSADDINDFPLQSLLIATASTVLKK